LAVSSTGGIVSPGQKIMDIVPKEEELLIDAHIPPFMIDKVNVGMEADVRFSTFSNAPQLVAVGKIVSLSTDAVPETNPTSPMSAQNTFYLARVEITPEGMKTLGHHVMQPGMPTEVLIKTGERSMLKYLLSPLTKRIASALKEE
jgi:protease secretion system membrane fusion protein